MAIGTVKWFNNAKGYGFILSEEGNEDLFAHYSSIDMDGYKTLKSGQQVNYELIQGPKGLHATNIKALGYVPDQQPPVESAKLAETPAANPAPAANAEHITDDTLEMA